MKDYLVVLTGSPRGGEVTWNYLYKNVLNVLDADLALCTTDKFLENNSLFQKAKFKWIFEEYDDFFDYYREHFDKNWENYFNKGLDTGLYTSGSIHFVFKDYILKNHIQELKNYKYIIYSRFDQLHISPHPPGVENKILIPEGEDYFGVCDRHAMFPSNMSEKYLNICEFIDSNETMKFEETYLNCEVTYKNQLINNNLINYVTRFPRSQFTTALKGEPTNWRVPSYKLYFISNLMIKYPDEFISSMKNQISSNSVLYSLFKNFLFTLNYFYLEIRKQLGKVKRIFFNYLIRFKMLNLIFCYLILSKYKYSSFKQKEFNAGYGEISTSSKVVIPIDKIYGNLYSSTGYRTTPLDQTPHYKYINSFYNSKNVNKEEYINYLKKYFPEINHDQKLDIFKNLKNEVEKNPNNFFILIKRDFDLFNTGKVKIIDGLHRAAILKSLGKTEIDCFIVDEIKYF